MHPEAIEILQKALADHGVVLKNFAEGVHDRQEKLAARLFDLEQKLDRRPSMDGGGSGEHRPGALAKMLMDSEGLAAFRKGTTRSVEIKVPSALVKAAILNASPLDNNQPLVAPMRQQGIVVAPSRRLTIRSLLPQVPTQSNLVDFTRELTFTNNAGPQGSGSSPAETEGQPFNESAISFELASAPVITIGTWLPASRQVLDDAPALQAFVENRLTYGLRLEEEDELLNGTGASGKLNGLINQATAFNAGSTNLTALDALALGIGQLVASAYQPSGIVVHPSDWFSSKILLAKTTTGEYLLGEPADMAAPALWGLPVAVTPAIAAGTFMVLDGQRAATIYDREEAVMRISESHADFFVRGMVALLIDERLALAVQQAGAIVHGSLNYAG